MLTNRVGCRSSGCGTAHFIHPSPNWRVRWWTAKSPCSSVKTGPLLSAGGAESPGGRNRLLKWRKSTGTSTEANWPEVAAMERSSAGTRTEASALNGKCTKVKCWTFAGTKKTRIWWLPAAGTSRSSSGTSKVKIGSKYSNVTVDRSETCVGWRVICWPLVRTMELSRCTSWGNTDLSEYFTIR